ncbi:MAG: HAD-IIA family hydrolase [Chloroflexota bacterium]
MIKNIKAALIDLDGTVYFKNQLIPGVELAINQLREAGLYLKFLTNVDSRSGAQLAERLSDLGLPLDASEIYTAADAAAAYTNQLGKTCFCLMPSRLDALFNQAPDDANYVDFVVLGDQSGTATYQRLNRAFRYLRAEAELVVMQGGRFYINEQGENLDTGAFGSLLEVASGKKATIVGKPSPTFFQGALAEFGVSPHEAIVVGDDIYSDIAGAKSIGAQAILVKTGKYEQQLGEMKDSQPDYIIDSLANLPRIL